MCCRFCSAREDGLHHESFCVLEYCLLLEADEPGLGLALTRWCLKGALSSRGRTTEDKQPCPVMARRINKLRGLCLPGAHHAGV